MKESTKNVHFSYDIALKFVSGLLTVFLASGLVTGCSGRAVASNRDFSNTINITDDLPEKSTNESVDLFFESIKRDSPADAYDYEEDVQIYQEVIGAGNIVKVFEASYYDTIFGDEVVNLDTLYASIDQNENLNDYFRELLKEFCDHFTKYAPKADLRILNYNLKSLVLRESDKNMLLVITNSPTVLACYLYRDNEIVVLEDNDYRNNNWDYQVLFHELSHAARIARIESNDHKYYVQSGDQNFDCTILDETLNTVFSVGILGFDEKDIGYQFQSNMVTAIVRSMDNYEIADYINHSQSYFLNKLDQYTGKPGYAKKMMELMNKQYTAYDEKKRSVNQRKMYPLYDYVSEIYYKDRITEGMPYEKAVKVRDELIELVSFDVPKEYKVAWKRFNVYFNQYCKERGITASKNRMK